MQKYKGQLGLLAVAIIWGSGFAASAVAVEHYSPLQIMALRFLIGTVLMCTVFFKHLRRIKHSTLLCGGFLGLVLYLAFYFQTIGLVHTTASKNAFLTAVNVVIVPIIAFFFFKLPISRNVVIGAISSICGIGVISLDKVSGLNMGDGLTLICAVFFALQIILTNLFLKKEEPIALTLVQLGSAAIIGIIICILNGTSVIGNSTEGNIAVLYLGAISTMLAYLIQTIAQKYTSSAEAAVILSTEGFFGMLASIIFLHEQITAKMLIGALLIFFGIIVTELPVQTLLVNKVRKESYDKKETYNKRHS